METAFGILTSRSPPPGCHTNSPGPAWQAPSQRGKEPDFCNLTDFLQKWIELPLGIYNELLNQGTMRQWP